MPNTKIIIEHRLTCLEGKVDMILSNHLPHIQKELEELRTKLDRGMWLLITSIAGIATTLILEVIRRWNEIIVSL